MGIDVRIWPMPVEVPTPIRFDLDTAHHAYDRAAVERWWCAMLNVHAALETVPRRVHRQVEPRSLFLGQLRSRGHALQRKKAPPREGADAMTREAYSHEVISVGFWPGASGVSDAAFYAYAAPEPQGFARREV